MCQRSPRPLRFNDSLGGFPGLGRHLFGQGKDTKQNQRRERKVQGEKPGGSRVQASTCPLLAVSSRTGLLVPRQCAVTACGNLSARCSTETLCPGFLFGVGRVGTSAQRAPTFQISRGKAGVPRKPHCIDSSDTVSHS